MQMLVLKDVPIPIHDMFRDGKMLLKLLEILSGERLVSLAFH
jgi:hypothetical protein